MRISERILLKRAKRSADPEIEAELIAQLFTAAVPVAIIGASMAGFCALLAWQTGDPVLALLAAVSVLLTSGRLAIIALYRRSEASTLDPHAWERIYAAGCIAFSLSIGVLGAYALIRLDPMATTIALGLLFAYCAGIVARLSVRPWLAMTVVGLAALPFVVAMILDGSTNSIALAVFIVMIAAGSFETILHSHATVVDHLTTRQRLAALAGLDALTGLPNRLMLDEKLDDLLQDGAAGLIAVHFVDLDQFKAANDAFGHPAGDAILREVARRLEALARDGSFPARLGGDEFVVVQPGISQAAEAEWFGLKIVRALSAPYAWQDGSIVIGASVGVALAKGRDMSAAEIVKAADSAMYAAKRDGRGTVSVRDLAAPREAAVHTA